MHIRLSTLDPVLTDLPLLVLFLPEGIREPEGVAAAADTRLGGALRRALDRGDFRGKKEETLLLFPPAESEGGPGRFLFVGVGRAEELDAETLRRAMGRAVRVAEGLRLGALAVSWDPFWSVAPALSAQALVEGAVLAAWDFRELKSCPPEGQDGLPPPVQELTLVWQGEPSQVREGMRIGLAQARGENLARTLQARPGNLATPAHMAEEALRLAQRLPLQARILGPEELRAEGMEALLAVARGSEAEPRLIVLEYWGRKNREAPLVLVGKGLTFDAGGISLKPAQGMEEMKFDMSGGAAVLGALQAVAELELELNVVGIVPCAENLPSGRALKPGDVIRTRAGKTVEVVNTDAEGRLILADALSYAQEYRPAAVVDCATLTGACVVALGHVASAVLGTHEGLVEELRRAGDRSGERCWPLPLWKEYREQLDSQVADLMNVGGRPAGTITAAAFLREFVGDLPWAHLDIAGTAYGEGKLSYQRKGGLGVPTRLLVEWIRSREAS